jgi:hypothetical protein
MALFLYSYFIIKLKINSLIKKNLLIKKYWPQRSKVAIFDGLPKLCSLVFKAMYLYKLDVNIISSRSKFFY